MWSCLVATFFLAAAPQADNPKEVQALARAIRFLGRYHKNPVQKARSVTLAQCFIKYGRRWSVDPWLAASVACQESIFKDRPRRIRIRRCKTSIRRGVAFNDCRSVWAGERGVMQVIPAYVKEGFVACKGRPWKSQDELSETDVAVCVGVWLMARKRNRIWKKIRRGLAFKVRGGGFDWSRSYHPCSKRQKQFCHNGNKGLCRRFWWVASYNWGSHKILCGRIDRTIDFEGYPIRIIRRYKTIVTMFGKGVKSLHGSSAQRLASEAGSRQGSGRDGSSMLGKGAPLEVRLMLQAGFGSKDPGFLGHAMFAVNPACYFASFRIFGWISSGPGSRSNPSLPPWMVIQQQGLWLRAVRSGKKPFYCQLHRSSGERAHSEPARTRSVAAAADLVPVMIKDGKKGLSSRRRRTIGAGTPPRADDYQLVRQDHRKSFKGRFEL